MSFAIATKEAENRVNHLPIPPAPERLDGLTVTLVNFETDGVAAGLVGGNSATFQRMINRAARQLLKDRGATVKLDLIKLDHAIQWATDEAPPLTRTDKLLFVAEMFDAVLRNHRTLPEPGGEFHRQLIALVKDCQRYAGDLP